MECEGSRVTENPLEPVIEALVLRVTNVLKVAGQPVSYVKLVSQVAPWVVEELVRNGVKVARQEEMPPERWLVDPKPGFCPVEVEQVMRRGITQAANQPELEIWDYQRLVYRSEDVSAE